jgi:hypothetical protein
MPVVPARSTPTDPGRVVDALFLGARVGGTVTSVPVALFLGITSIVSGGLSSDARALFELFITLPCAVVAVLLVDARVGWTAAGLAVALALTITGIASGSPGNAAMVVFLSLVSWPIAVSIWTAGLTLFGGPCWFMLHAMKLRSLRVATITGAGLTFGFAACLGLPAAVPAVPEGAATWIYASALSAVGAYVGRVVARTAYGQEDAG